MTKILKIITLILLLQACTPAYADVTIVDLTTCKAVDPINPDWTCYNRTQAADRPEVLLQVAMAVKNARFTKDLVIYSIDPLRDREGAYNFGVWVRNGKLFFSAMPGCYQARVRLERELKRRMRKG